MTPVLPEQRDPAARGQSISAMRSVSFRLCVISNPPSDMSRFIVPRSAAAEAARVFRSWGEMQDVGGREAVVGFYLTRPVNWAGFMRLPESAEEAANASRTIRYKMERVRAWARGCAGGRGALHRSAHGPRHRRLRRGAREGAGALRGAGAAARLRPIRLRFLPLAAPPENEGDRRGTRLFAGGTGAGRGRC